MNKFLSKFFEFFGLSFQRVVGIARKEFKLILRDRGTLLLITALPITLLMIFGFAIQLDPKNLPTQIINYDLSPVTRSLVANMGASGYFNIVDANSTESSSNNALLQGDASLILTIPADFERSIVRGNVPTLLVEIDGADPGNVMSATKHLQHIIDATVADFLTRGLIDPKKATVTQHNADLIVHRNFNESDVSAFNIVPGLIGVLLMITMVAITSTAITSERESGTIELLLSTPATPTEIIIGKTLPYVVLGYMQLTIVIVFGRIVLGLPVEGSLIFLLLASAPFVVANLLIGMIFSAIANSPMQALQLSIYFQLPSIFLTGYVFSFHGMPVWAQSIGYMLPMTYFLRICRGIFLKGASFISLMPDVLAITLIAAILGVLAKKLFKKSID